MRNKCDQLTWIKTSCLLEFSCTDGLILHVEQFCFIMITMAGNGILVASSFVNAIDQHYVFV